jgi:hypothetical protein
LYYVIRLAMDAEKSAPKAAGSSKTGSDSGVSK